MKKLFVLLLVLIAICSHLLGCSTIIYGKRQDLSINTIPPGAVARVGTQSCITPCTLLVSRKEKSIFIQQDNIERQYPLTRSYHLATFLFGNLVWGLFPGMIVDATSGGRIGLEDVNIVTRSEVSGGKKSEVAGEKRSEAGGQKRKVRSSNNDI